MKKQILNIAISLTVLALGAASVHAQAFAGQYAQARKSGDLKKAADLLQTELNSVDLEILRSYMESGKTEEFISYAKMLVEEGGKTNAQLLDGVAWCIVGPDPKDARNGDVPDYNGVEHHPDEVRTRPMLELAKTAINRAVEITERKNAGDLDTLAWAQYRLGDKSGASQTEKEAAEKCPQGHTQKLYDTMANWFTSK